MSHTFIGIDNVNEFFTQHYLAAILTRDLSPILGRWKEAALGGEGAKATPPRRLFTLQQDFFRYLEALRSTQDPTRRVELQREIFAGLLDALGFKVQQSLATIASGHLPLLANVQRPDGSPVIWCVLAVSESGEDATLSRRLMPEQLEGIDQEDWSTHDDEDLELRCPTEKPLEGLIGEIFDLDEPPRFVLLCGDDDVTLIERSKWADQRLIKIDLSEVLGRKELPTLNVVAALLHRESLAPESGRALLDELNDNSHKHAFEVSEDLKYALQASIERLGNAALMAWWRAARKTNAARTNPLSEDTLRAQITALIDAEQLSRECLRFMYRLLFLFYIEARPELGYAPTGNEAYRLGYGLERLRELELLELQTDEARQGSYINDSLKLLFKMIHEGVEPAKQSALDLGDRHGRVSSLIGIFELKPLKSHLFDTQRTKFLDSVTLPNDALRDIIEWMSLTRVKAAKTKGRSQNKGRRRGRISYATLGINQLGAVYEALLSFRGFFAQHELFEVKSKKEKERDVLKTAYFVPEEDLHRYSEAERVYESDHVTLRRYPRHTFIYRLAGRDRQTSASFYTPEVLTRSLVKYTLKELLEDKDGKPTKTADELLKITICEPAMGSAAFLNEAVNQLAEAYLRAKQRELGERIPHERYNHEKQRVKMYIADNNVYGVDLNPIAVELAEISLWLNTIHAGNFVPWFGGQLTCGNSLIGARRQVFRSNEVSPTATKSDSWLDSVPQRHPLDSKKKRPKNSVYHFLLGDRGMSVYGQGNEGKPIRQMEPANLKLIDRWRADFCAPLTSDDHEDLVHLSDAIDRLWRGHVALLRKIRHRTSDPLGIYGHPLPADIRPPTTTAEKDAVWWAELTSETVRASSPYRRLKLVMDYWCALWFWPIEHAELLPDREEFISDVALLIDSNILFNLSKTHGQLDLFATTRPADESRKLVQEHGFVDVHKVITENKRLALVEKLAQKHHFLHWELDFADLFADQGGFDVMLGNPPWIPIQWKEQWILSDADPSFALKKLSASETVDLRKETFERYGNRPAYLSEHENNAGTQDFLSAKQNYPDLQGTKTNLYKCFLPVTWSWTNKTGVSGLLHPEGIYDDPKGGALREALYPRLRRHYQFSNELDLFPDIQHQKKFSLNISGSKKPQPHFQHLANLFAATTIEDSIHHFGQGLVPGLKEGGKWGVRGHRDRILKVTRATLKTFAALYDKAGTPPLQARLPAIHSKQLSKVLECFLEANRRLSHLNYFATFIFNETYAQKDKTIRRETNFPDSPKDLIISGPHFFVGNPHYKTPRAICTLNSHYDVLDLTTLPADYLPRGNYVRACSPAEYEKRTPKVPWSGEPVTSFYRVVVSKMIGPAGERTLQPALCATGVAHIDSVYSYTFKNYRDLLAVTAAWASVPVDFFLKSTGLPNFHPNLAKQLPITTKHLGELFVRTLLLNCLTSHFGELWGECFEERFVLDGWAKEDGRLLGASFGGLSGEWGWETPLRTDYARRQALVEIDVLVSMGLGLTLEQLQTIYRAQFYVLKQNEDDTWYDARGRIVFTASKGLVGVGLKRKMDKKDTTMMLLSPEGTTEQRALGWEDVRGLEAGWVVRREIEDDTLPGGPKTRWIEYHAPFDRCDREADYAVVWAHFLARGF